MDEINEQQTAQQNERLGEQPTEQPTETPLEQPSKKSTGPLKKVLRALGVVLGIIIVAIGAFLITPYTEAVDATKVDGSQSWMSRLDGTTQLSDVVLPGTHDSATMDCDLGYITKCQALSIADQLDAGFRYLDIRLAADAKANDMVLMHGFLNCRTGLFGGPLYVSSVLEDCYAFLDANPTEAIVFAVKQEHGDESVAQFEQLLDQIIQQHPDRWLLTDRIPTVDEARGKLVLMRRYEDEAGLGTRAGIPLLWENQNGHSDTTLNIVREQNPTYTLWVQDRYEYDAEDKWRAFYTGMTVVREGVPVVLGGANEDAPAELVGPAVAGDVSVHFLSTKGTFVQGHPFGYAKELNPRLAALSSGEMTGWIVIDFGSALLASHIYEANFAQEG